MQYSLFEPDLYYCSEWYKFKKSRWGKLRAILPIEELAALLPSNSGLGRNPYFDNAGKIALQFLKHETGLSDESLLEHLNHNPSLQYFCGIHLGHHLIGDTGILSRIRSFVSEHLDWDKFQDILINHWKSDLSDPQFLKMDATCYPSYIRYPTDVELLWESGQWVYEQLFELRQSVKIPLGKEKERYQTQRKKYLIYSKLRRKTKKKINKRIRSLLNWLQKGLSALQSLINPCFKANLAPEFYTYLKTIKEVYQQQYYLFTHPDEKSVPNRIVSLSKPYIRPIKRGKIKTPNEFGAKVHLIQVDGLTVIEHLSFENFNECKRLKSSVKAHQKWFGKCEQLSADGIYPTNENRTFCRQEHIFTGFVPKGRKPKHYKTIQTQKQALNKDRATRLEGGFGNQKNHYGLDKIKAKTQPNEVSWIYFGVWTANAVWIAKKRANP